MLCYRGIGSLGKKIHDILALIREDTLVECKTKSNQIK